MLANSGKTLADLHADCAKLPWRMWLEASLDRRPSLEVERAKIDDQIAAADRLMHQTLNPGDVGSLPKL